MGTRPPVLIATVGLPGSGKSTWARGQRDTRDLCAVVERDTFRDMLGYRWDAPHGVRDQMERVVTAAEHAAVTAFLAAGADVVVADTNLATGHLGALSDVAGIGAWFVVRDFTNVPVDECVRRDAQRPAYEPGGLCSGRSVGEAVIRRMWEKYTATHPGTVTRAG